MLLAVLDRRAGIDLGGHDVYALAVGGVKLTDPGVDLGVALALASSLHDRALPDGLVVFGEIGLGGELRQVSQCTASAHRGGAARLSPRHRAPTVAGRARRHRGVAGGHAT